MRGGGARSMSEQHLAGAEAAYEPRRSFGGALWMYIYVRPERRGGRSSI